MRISDWSSDVCSSDLEACVYRRLTSGTAVDALGLDRWIDAERLELSNLAEREDVPEIPLKALEARRPGSFELDQGSVFWQPPNGEAGEGAIQLLNRAGAALADIPVASFARVGTRRTEIGRASGRDRVGPYV